MGKRKLRLVADELRRGTEFERGKRTIAGPREGGGGAMARGGFRRLSSRFPAIVPFATRSSAKSY